MTLSIWQKIQLILLRSVLMVLWWTDLFSYYTSKNFPLKAVRALVVIGFVSLVGINVYSSAGSLEYGKNLKLLRTGLNVYVNGQPELIFDNQSESSQVLGFSGKSFNPPLLKDKKAFPFISAKAHLVIDNNSNTILSEHNVNRTFAPASTTKLMTALVSLDVYSMDELLEISPECTQIESTKLWLPAGESFYVKDMIYSLLISSAGDVSCSLASGKEELESFIELMNEKATDLGMINSHFTNPIGLDGENGSHYSSVWDLYLLSEKAMSNSFIRDIVKTDLYSFSGAEKEDLKVNIENTNLLLRQIPGTIGIKTGRTTGAGEVLIYRYDDGEKDLTIIVMSSDDRFSDTEQLLEWTLDSYSW